MSEETKSILESTVESSGNKPDLVGISEQVKSKHGGARQGAGRKARGKVVATPTDSKEESTADVVSPEDVQFAKEAYNQIARLLNEGLSAGVYRSAVAIDISLDKKGKEYAEAVRMSEKQIELNCLAVEKEAHKLGALLAYMPLGVIAISHGFQIVKYFKISSELSAIKRELILMKSKAAQDASTPQAN